MFIDYNTSIISYISSIRKFFNLEIFQESNQKFDALLQSSNKHKIILMVIDGMGYNLLNKLLDNKTCLKTNLKFQTSTVFPSATTAATICIQNGKAPSENSWLGWCTYFEEVADHVIPFLGKSYYGDDNYGDIAYKLIPYSTTEQELKIKGLKTDSIWPKFKEGGYTTLQEMTKQVITKSKENDYLYVYIDEFDTCLHINGTTSDTSKELLKEIDQAINEIKNNLDDDALLVVTADHGQIDIEEVIDLSKSPFKDYFYRLPSLEPRACSFYVKEEFKESFEKEFKEQYSEDFILFTKEQVIDLKLFGEKNNPRFESMLGDFLAIGKTKKVLHYLEGKEMNLKGQHSGIHEDELYVPVIVISKT